MNQLWQPTAIVFVGLQGSGKSTFYLDRFFRSHVRINLDMLRTRHRETRLLHACIDMLQPFVVDNTNPTTAERAKYIAPARAAGFRIVGYHFPPDIRACIDRNNMRSGKERVPIKAIIGTAKRMETPTLAEGFDEMHAVVIEHGRFVVGEQRS
jgi:predicted kinase